MKSLTLFVASIFAVLLSGCGDSSTNPKMAAPDYIHIKTGTTYKWLGQELDSSLHPKGLSMLDYTITHDNLTFGGKNNVLTMSLSASSFLDSAHIHFGENGDIELLNVDKSTISDWVRFPFYSQQTFTHPSKDSTDSLGYRTVSNGTIVYDGTDTVIIGGTTFDALRAKETKNRNYYNPNSATWWYDTEISTLWFIPKLGFVGKSYSIDTERDKDQNVTYRNGGTGRIISYTIKQ